MTSFSFSRIQDVVSKIACLDRKFILLIRDPFTLTLHVEYHELDVDAPEKGPCLQQSRKWLINWDADETEVVETAFACVMRSYDHVVKEHFLYRGARVHSPHFTITQRLAACPGRCSCGEELPCHCQNDE